jgi:DNA repair protein RadC
LFASAQPNQKKPKMKLYNYTLSATCVCEDHPVEIVERPENIVSIMDGAFDAYPEQEQFWLVFLNQKNMVKGRMMLTLGTQTAVLAHPREVLRAALLANATAFVCVHNHPSGDPTPSGPDMNVTRLIREAARTMDITFQDHVIIGDPSADPVGKGFYSFRSAGAI